MTRTSFTVTTAEKNWKISRSSALVDKLYANTVRASRSRVSNSFRFRSISRSSFLRSRSWSRSTRSTEVSRAPPRSPPRLGDRDRLRRAPRFCRLDPPRFWPPSVRSRDRDRSLGLRSRRSRDVSLRGGLDRSSSRSRFTPRSSPGGTSRAPSMASEYIGVPNLKFNSDRKHTRSSRASHRQTKEASTQFALTSAVTRFRDETRA